MTLGQRTLFDAKADKKPPRFAGADYVARRDDVRLRGQLARIWAVMTDGAWRTLPEIARLTHDPEASISAQLRHLRKERFGSHVVCKRHRGDEYAGAYEYRLTVNAAATVEVVEDGGGQPKADRLHGLKGLHG